MFRLLAVAFDLVLLLFSALLFQRFTLSDLQGYPFQVLLLAGACGVLTLLFVVDWGKSRFRFVLALLRGDMDTQWNMLMAAVVISNLPILIAFLVTQRFVIKGIATTGLKG